MRSRKTIRSLDDSGTLMRHQSFGHLKPHAPTRILKQTLTKQLCCMSTEMFVLPPLLSPAILVTGLLSPRCHACFLLLSLLRLSYVGFPFNCLHKCWLSETWPLVPSSRQSLVALSEVLLDLLGCAPCLFPPLGHASLSFPISLSIQPSP